LKESCPPSFKDLLILFLVGNHQTETKFLSRWVVWLICTKGVNVRDDLLHSITVWRLRKEETSGKEIVRTKKRRKINLIHGRGGGRRSHRKKKMTVPKDYHLLKP
jgi:hypothetical protein